MIEHITPEQDQLLTDQVADWLRIGRSTEPLDRPAATRSIQAMYQALGRQHPTVLFFSSPAMCILAWNALRALATERPQLRRRLEEPLRDLLCERWERLAKRLGDRLDRQISCEVEDHVTLDVHPNGQLWNQLELRLGTELRRQLQMQLENPPGDLWQRLGEQLGDQLTDWSGGQVWDPVDGRLGGVLSNCLPGSWGCEQVIVFDYYRCLGVVYEPRQEELLALWTQQCRHCHWWFPYKGLALVSERPRVLSVDEAGRLHGTQGPALEYGDGYSLHAWHGVPVEPRLITEPASITVSEIEHESNAELRRVMIERYGWTRYITDCGARVVDQVPEDHPVLGLRGARLLVKELAGEREPIVYLEMINSTAEADGTHKRYLERIDPKAYGGDAGRLCHAAMASRWHHRNPRGLLVRTFRDWRDYVPSAES